MPIWFTTVLNEKKNEKILNIRIVVLELKMNSSQERNFYMTRVQYNNGGREDRFVLK